jgi:predicted acylesterase/phospholipase RssA
MKVRSPLVYGLLIACFILAFSLSSFAQSPKTLTVGVVGYSNSLDTVGKEFIKYLNRKMRLPDGYRIHEAPAVLSYENAVAYEDQRALDIALLTPITWIKVSKTVSPENPDLRAVALVSMGADRAHAGGEYVGKILFDANALNKGDLTKRKGGKARVALIPGSASAYYYPIDKFATAIAPLKGAVDWPTISSYFDVRYSQKQSESLDLLFDKGPKVDVAPVYAEELYSYMESDDPAKTKAAMDKVRAWLKKCSGVELPDSASIEDVVKTVYEKCSWNDTASIPGDVIVVRKHEDIRNLPDLVKAALQGLNTELAKDMPPTDIDDLRNAMKARRMVDFRTDEGQIKRLYDAAKGKFENLSKSEKVFGATALEVVSEIAYDIRSKVGLGVLGPQHPPKVALVLSGGGASGAYEAGALIELLKAFHRFKADNYTAFNEKFRPDDLRLHTFVGTSVGSVNAVAAALMQKRIEELEAAGRGSADDGQIDKGIDGVAGELRTLWKGITGDRVLRGVKGEDGVAVWIYITYLLLNRGWAIVLLGIVVVQLFVHFYLTYIVGLTIKDDKDRAYALLAAALIVALFISWHDLKLGLAVFHIVLISAMYIRITMVDPKDRPPTIKAWWLVFPAAGLAHTFTLAFLFNIFHVVPDGRAWLVAFLFVIDASLMVQIGAPFRLNAVRIRLEEFRLYKHSLLIPRVGGLVALVIILPILAVDALYLHDGLFKSEPLQNVITSAYSGLLGTQSTDIGKSILDALKSSKTEVVVTTTDFTSYQDGVPPKELYFYRVERSLRKTVTDDLRTKRWVNMTDYPDQFMDMIMASAAIFPGFPPRQVKKVKVSDAMGNYDEEASFALIDGGYLHNVPVQAAVQLGATHIIVIDIHPAVQPMDGKAPQEIALGPNLINAFDLLFDRAQSADILAVSELRTFRLAPKDRPIGVADFDGHWDGFFGLFQGQYPLAQFLSDGSLDATVSKTVGREDHQGFEQLSLGRLFTKPVPMESEH